MPDIANPYIPGQPVDNPELFFGRREALASVREHLTRGRRVFVLSGAPRIGKSSLLRQLSARLPEDYVYVRVDLAEESPKRLDWLLWRLSVVIAEQVSSTLGIRVAEPDWSEFEAQTNRLLDDFQPRIRSELGARCLVLILDDVDSISGDGNELFDRFISFLSHWRENDAQLALVVSMTAPGDDVHARQHPRLFGGAVRNVLEPLSSEEATRLITWPAHGILTYDYGVARRMIEITSGHPYFLQLLCRDVFERCASAGWVNQRDVDYVVDALVQREIADFRLLWDESSGQEQASLAALVSLRGARGVATVREVHTALIRAGAKPAREQVAQALESLAARGILERMGALSYRFRVALLRDWLGERLDLLEIVRGTRWDGSEPARRPGEHPVSRLAVHGAASKEASPAVSDSKEPDGAGEGERPASSRWLLWIVLAAVLLLLLVAAAATGWLRPVLIAPAATPSVQPTATRAVLATATWTLERPSVTPSIVAVAPTETSRPAPTLTPSPTPPIVLARPVPSIAYQAKATGESGWSIFLMNSDGSNRLFLTEGQSGFLSAPAWSPDGSRIALVSDRGGSSNIWTVATDGSDPLNITNHEAKDHSPAWSPDGEWIAFASVRDAAYWELYVMRPDGSDVQRITWWEDASDLSPSWSPDGSRLAFATKRDGNWEIYSMDPDGSNLRRLTDHPADDTNPAWSPDGSRIAFESTRDGFTDIFMMTVTGGSATNITNTPWATDLGPTWSPDGGRIAFYSDRDGAWDIHIMASDGSGPVKLTSGSTNDQVPSWRP
jgi:TolB protein